MTNEGRDAFACFKTVPVGESGWQPLVHDRLFDLKVRFNLFPATYAHASWIDQIGANISLAYGLDKRCDSQFWLRRLSVSLLRAHDLEHSFDFDFYDRAKRIALLDAAVFERTARLLAGLLMRDRIKHIVLGNEVAAIEHAMGRDAHRFSLAWTGSLPLLSFTFLRPEDESFRDQGCWTRLAVRLVSALLPESSPGTLARLQFKFPCEWAKLKRSILSDTDREKLMGLFMAVIQKAEPDSTWLFTSAPT